MFHIRFFSLAEAPCAALTLAPARPAITRFCSFTASSIPEDPVRHHRQMRFLRFVMTNIPQQNRHSGMRDTLQSRNQQATGYLLDVRGALLA